MVVVSVMDVRRVFGSCLISCFFLSNSCLPRRSFIVSLYFYFFKEREYMHREVRAGLLTISRN
jgi:hypothetical protein